MFSFFRKRGGSPSDEAKAKLTIERPPQSPPIGNSNSGGHSPSRSSIGIKDAVRKSLQRQSSHLVSDVDHDFFDEDEGAGEEHVDENITFDVGVEKGGGKGWPSDVSYVLYHRAKALICVGTEGGAVYAYGDGFQYMRPWLTYDANSVISMNAVGTDKLLIAFADDSLAVLAVPTLDVIDLIPGTWLGRNNGKVNYIHVDEPGGLNFAYVGTTTGTLIVLELVPVIRICDFTITSKDAGLMQDMMISEIQLCPKDEKYMAIGYDDAEDSGVVVIYDLTKRKVTRSYTTASVTSITWNHRGECLFVGTRQGDVLVCGLEKDYCNVVWNAESARSDASQASFGAYDAEGGGGGGHIFIRRLCWFAPQDNPLQAGCLFVLLGVLGGEAGDILKFVIAGLSSTSGRDGGDMSEILEIPPIPGEDVVGFRLIPTVDREVDQENGTVFVTDSSHGSVPGLLILTQKMTPEGSYTRPLKILRCPTSPICDWGMEIGLLPEPRVAAEVLPSRASVTHIYSLLPPTHNASFAAVMVSSSRLLSEAFDNRESTSIALRDSLQRKAQISEATSGHRPSINIIGSPSGSSERSPSPTLNKRRLSTRDFFATNDDENEEIDKWELVLAEGKIEVSNKTRQRLQDIVFVGHDDGTVIAWGVSSPQPGVTIGRGNTWLPLRMLRCGNCNVCLIYSDESNGFLVIGNEAGEVCVMELLESENNRGLTARLRDKKASIQQAAHIGIINDALGGGAAYVGQDSDEEEDGFSDDEGDDDEDDDEDDEDYDEEDSDYEDMHHRSKPQQSSSRQPFHPDDVRMFMKVTLPSPPVVSLIVAEATTLIIGTYSGEVYVSSDLRAKSLKEVELSFVGASGPVVALHYSSFWYASKSIPACYIMYESGHLVVIHLHTLEVLAISDRPGAVVDVEEDDFDSIRESKKSCGLDYLGAAVMCVLDAERHILPRQHPLHEVGADGDVTVMEPAVNFVMEPGGSPQSKSPNGEVKQRRSFFSPKSPRNNSPHNEPPLPPSPYEYDMHQQQGESSGSRKSLSGRKSFSSSASPSPPSPRNHFIPRGHARFVLVIHGRTLYTYDLSWFATLIRPGSYSFTSFVSSSVHTSTICKKNIIAGSIVWYVEEASKAWSKPVACFSAVDRNGTLLTVAIRTRKPVCHADLLEGVLDTPVNLEGATVLASGNCYMHRHGSFIFSATPKSDSFIHLQKLPDRASTDCTPPRADLQLKSGREDILAARHLAVQKRRQSMIVISSAPTDLTKIFAKSRDQLNKDALLGRNFDADSQQQQSPSSSARSAASKAADTLSDMAELKEKLEERGERLRRIAENMDKFKDSARDFRAGVAQQKMQLQAKNDRWGF